MHLNEHYILWITSTMKTIKIWIQQTLIKPLYDVICKLMWLTWTHRAALARHRHRIITNGETLLLLTGHHSVVTEAGHTGVGVQGELWPIHVLAPIERTTCQISGRKLILHLLFTCIGFILILVFLWKGEVYNTYWYYDAEKCTAENVSERLYLLFLSK